MSQNPPPRAVPPATAAPVPTTVSTTTPVLSVTEPIAQDQRTKIVKKLIDTITQFQTGTDPATIAQQAERLEAEAFQESQNRRAYFRKAAEILKKMQQAASATPIAMGVQPTTQPTAAPPPQPSAGFTNATIAGAPPAISGVSVHSSAQPVVTTANPTPSSIPVTVPAAAIGLSQPISAPRVIATGSGGSSVSIIPSAVPPQPPPSDDPLSAKLLQIRQQFAEPLQAVLQHFDKFKKRALAATNNPRAMKHFEQIEQLKKRAHFFLQLCFTTPEILRARNHNVEWLSAQEANMSNFLDVVRRGRAQTVTQPPTTAAPPAVAKQPSVVIVDASAVQSVRKSPTQAFLDEVRRVTESATAEQLSLIANTFFAAVSAAGTATLGTTPTHSYSAVSDGDAKSATPPRYAAEIVDLSSLNVWFAPGGTQVTTAEPPVPLVVAATEARKRKAIEPPPASHTQKEGAQIVDTGPPLKKVKTEATAQPTAVSAAGRAQLRTAQG